MTDCPIDNHDDLSYYYIGGDIMPDYEAMYFELAAKVADAIELLTKAQQEGEEAYIRAVDDVFEQAINCDEE